MRLNAVLYTEFLENSPPAVLEDTSSFLSTFIAWSVNCDRKLWIRLRSAVPLTRLHLVKPVCGTLHVELWSLCSLPSSPGAPFAIPLTGKLEDFPW